MIRNVLLGDIIETIIDYRGKTPKKLGGNWSAEGYRAFSAKNIENGKIKNVESIRYVDKSLYKKWMKEEIERSDILLTSEAPLGQLMFWDSDEKIVLSQRLFGIRAKKDIVDPSFLYAYLSSPTYQSELEARSTGSTVKGIRQAELVKTQLSLPSMEQQKRIGSFVRAIDEAIALNRRMNETLEQMGQALFRHYFINNSETKKWNKRELGEFFAVKTGKKDANFGTDDGEYPFFTCAQTISKAPDYSFDAHALLLAGNGDFNLKLYRGKFEAYQRTYVLIPNNEKLLGVLYFLMSIRLTEITGGSRGSVIRFITKGMIEHYKFTLPGDEELARIGGIFNRITLNIEENVRQVQTLIDLRDTLIPGLISGKVGINGID